MYKGFDIGSAKPSSAELKRYPHYLFDALPSAADYDAKAYRKDALAAMEDIRALGRVPVVVGGTGLYLRALMNRDWHDNLPSCPKTRAELAEQESAALYRQLEAKDPTRAAELHPNDRLRVMRALEIILLTGSPVSQLYARPAHEDANPPPPWWVIHLDPPRTEVLANIEQRTGQLLDQGLVAEVEGLLAMGLSPNLKPFASIGYKQVMQALAADSVDTKRLAEAITIATRQYAKRQRTLFRGIAGDITTRLTSPRLTEGLVAELRDRYQALCL